MVAPIRLPNFKYSRTARMRSSYEYMNYLQVVQVFVRSSSGSVRGANQHYVDKRVTEGHSKLEAIRCLKRYVAREIFNAMPSPVAI